MKVTRSRTLRFCMAQYESIEISATVEADDTELPDDRPSAVILDDMLDEMMLGDVERAAEMSRTSKKDTFVHDWKDEVSQ